MKQYITGELVIGIVLIFLGLFTFVVAGNYHTQTGGVGPAFFPRVMSILLILLSAVLIYFSILKPQSLTESSDASQEEIVVSTQAFGKIIICIVGLIVYWWVMYYLGYIGPSIAYLVFMMLLLGERNWLKISCWSIGLPVLLYIAFERILNVPLPMFDIGM